MKLLFVCLSNVNRSQIAEAIVQAVHPDWLVASAGAQVPVSYQGKFVREVDTLPVRLMQERGYDLSEHRVKQITDKMVTAADRIISFATTDELPEFVRRSPKVELWDEADPGGKGEAVLENTIADLRRQLAERRLV